MLRPDAHWHQHGDREVLRSGRKRSLFVAVLLGCRSVANAAARFDAPSTTAADGQSFAKDARAPGLGAAVSSDTAISDAPLLDGHCGNGRVEAGAFMYTMVTGYRVLMTTL